MKVATWNIERYNMHEEWSELMFNRFTLGLMLNALNSGSEYTKDGLSYKKVYCDEVKTSDMIHLLCVGLE